MKTISEQFNNVQPLVEKQIAKTPIDVETSHVAPIVEEVKHVSGSFSVQTNRIMDDIYSTIKTRGMYKVRIQNKGQVAIKVFGNFDLPSYADETFESGDSVLGFSNDAEIQYAPHSPVDSINIVVTGYTRM